MAVGVDRCSFHLVELAEELLRLLADLAAMVGPELVELSPGVRHAADLGHSQFEPSLVPGEVVTDELALSIWLAWRPGQSEEVAGMLPLTGDGRQSVFGSRLREPTFASSYPGLTTSRRRPRGAFTHPLPFKSRFRQGRELVQVDRPPFIASSGPQNRISSHHVGDA